MSTSPTQNTLKRLRAEGYTAAVVVSLTKSQIAIVNEEDYEQLTAGRKWVASWSGRRWYAVRGKGKTREYMHRLIAGARRGQFVDHADGDSLNNLRANLRICTQKENSRNSSSRASESGYKGVARHHDGIRWCGRITVDRKNLYLGTFTDPWDAAKAYNNAALIHFGSFAKLNLKHV